MNLQERISFKVAKTIEGRHEEKKRGRIDISMQPLGKMKILCALNLLVEPNIVALLSNFDNFFLCDMINNVHAKTQ